MSQGLKKNLTLKKFRQKSLKKVKRVCNDLSFFINNIKFAIVKVMMLKQKKQKILFMASYVLIACIFVYFLKPVYLVSIFIVLGPPSIANFLWLKESRFKIFIFSLLTTILFAPPVEIMARLANSWDVQSILPRLFGIAPGKYALCFY